MERGYYMNGLTAWRERLEREHRLAIARLECMKNMRHPDADDQALMVRHIEQMAEIIYSAERVARALERNHRELKKCGVAP